MSTENQPLHPDPATPGPTQLSDTAPPSPVSYERLSPLTPLVKGWIGLLAVAAVIGRQFLESGSLDRPGGGWLIWLAILGGLGGLSVLTGLISWRTTGFAVAPDALHIRRSFISQQTDTVVYRRIQSVDIVRPLAARLIGVAGLRIDVGGEGAPKLEYLSRSKADQLRDELLARAAVAHQQPAVQPGSPAAPASASTHPLNASTLNPGTPNPGALNPSGLVPGSLASGADPAMPGAIPPGGIPTPRVDQLPAITRVRCTPGQIITGTLTSSQFIFTALGILAFGIVPALIAKQVVTLGILIPLGFAMVGVLSNRLFKEWNYELATTADGVVRISRGLTDQVSQTVPTDRVQGFCLSQSLFAKPFGLWRVQFEVFGYHGDEADQGASTVLLPAGSWQQVLTALDVVWPGFNPASLPTQSLPARVRWFHPFALKTYRWGMDDHVVLSAAGLLEHHVAIVHQARAQSWSLSQGPVQRRLGLASVDVDITQGPVHLRLKNLDAAIARPLTDDLVHRSRAARQASWAVTRHAAPGQWPTAPPPTAAAAGQFTQSASMPHPPPWPPTPPAPSTSQGPLAVTPPAQGWPSPMAGWSDTAGPRQPWPPNHGGLDPSWAPDHRPAGHGADPAGRGPEHPGPGDPRN